MTVDRDQLHSKTHAQSGTSDTSPATPVASVDQQLATARDDNLDGSDPQAAIQANPQWGGIAMLAAAASLGASVPGAVSSAYAELFRSLELNGEFSISNGGGPLGTLTKEEIAAKKQADDDDGWSDWAQDMADRREKQERDQQDTMSQADLDALPWTGDLNEIWEMGGISLSREKLYEAAKAVRKKLPQLAKENDWTDAERKDQEHWLSEYERLIKAGDKEGAQKVRNEHFKPETKKAVIELERKALEVEAGVSVATAKAATDAASTSQESALSRNTLLSQIGDKDTSQMDGEAKPALTTARETRSGLTRDPAIELTAKFTEKAAPAVHAESNTQIALASVPATSTGAPAGLSQSFDL